MRKLILLGRVKSGNVGIAILVRHGESESNTKSIVSSDIDGYPLTSKGREQALVAAQQLSALCVDSVFSSPVQRARETASIISGEVGIAHLLDQRIMESGMGSYNNTVLSDIPKLSRKDLGMETWESHQARFEGALKDVKGISVMVSHAFPIRAALSLYLGMDEIESFGINIRNASMSVIDLESSRVLCIGSRFLSEKVKHYVISRKQ